MFISGRRKKKKKRERERERKPFLTIAIFQLGLLWLILFIVSMQFVNCVVKLVI